MLFYAIIMHSPQMCVSLKRKRFQSTQSYVKAHMLQRRCLGYYSFIVKNNGHQTAIR